MTTTHLLIDLENRQPDPAYVAAWIGDSGEAWIFYGEQQINLLPNYFAIGPQVSIVPISKPGKNSLDFHLVLYLGYLVAKRKRGSRFVIVAGDAGYDAAVAHARAEGVDVLRVSELASNQPIDVDPAPAASARNGVAQPEIAADATGNAIEPTARKPAKAVGANKTTIAIYAGILEDIRGPNRPRDMKALASRIQSRIGQRPAPDRVAAVIARLETMDVIKMTNGEMTYLPNADRRSDVAA